MKFVSNNKKCLLFQNSLQECGSCTSSSSGTGTDTNITPPSPPFPAQSSTSASTWDNWPDPPRITHPESSSVVERPHTISTAYETYHTHSRPALTSQTFERPDSQTAPCTPSPYAVPFALATDSKPPVGPKPRGRPVAPPVVPDFNMGNNDQSKTAESQLYSRPEDYVRVVFKEAMCN